MRDTYNMKMWSTIACTLVYLTFVAGATILSGRTWQQRSSGYLQQSGYTFKRSTRGLLDCSLLCSKIESSRSFFYNGVIKDCQCHDGVYNTTDVGMHPVANIRYFERQDCPADASLSTNVLKSDGKLFTVRAFLDIARTFDEAQTTCMSNGGVLYKVTTLEKFHIARQLLKECSSVYAPHAYWVNGKTSGITQEFETLDGEVIPMTSDFWAPGMPDQSGDCLWMWADYDYMLDDRECWQLTGFETYALCELPL